MPSLTNHYYSRRPAVKSQQEQLVVTLRNERLTFYTDRGVFSKGRIDFGTALLLQTITLAPDAKVLDVGCGYGPLGLTLAKESTGREVQLVDVNRRALDLARHNARENDIDHVVITESDMLTEVKDTDFDIIVSNPPIRAGKQLIYAFFDKSIEHLRPGGELWIVIQKKQGAASSYQYLQQLYPRVDEVTKKKGYRIIRALK